MNKLMSVMFAAVAGYAAGVLLAPKSGAETREELKSKAREAKERMNEKVKKAKEAAREATETLKEGASHAGTEVRGLAESARQSARTIAEEAVALGDEAKTRASRVVNETKQAVAAKKDTQGTVRPHPR